MFSRASVLVITALSAVDPSSMLRRADASHDAFREGLVQLRVVVVEKGKAPVDNLMALYVGGADRSLCVFREGKQKGRKILTVGDKVWLIVPTASKPVPVSKNQRLMGAASFGDIARLRFADEYDAALRPEPEGGLRVLDLAAKAKGAAYPKAVLAVDLGDGLARKLTLFLASGKEAKEVAFTAYGERSRIKTMTIRDLLTGKGENVTTLTFERYEERTLDPSTFDPEGARAIP